VAGKGRREEGCGSETGPGNIKTTFLGRTMIPWVTIVIHKLLGSGGTRQAKLAGSEVPRIQLSNSSRWVVGETALHSMLSPPRSSLLEGAEGGKGKKNDQSRRGPAVLARGIAGVPTSPPLSVFLV